MATSRASHLIKRPRDHSDHASKSDAQSSNSTDRQRRRQQARKQQESWNGASTTAGTTKKGTHWWIASIHWIARHRLDNYEDRALMSPWPKPKNSEKNHLYWVSLLRGDLYWSVPFGYPVKVSFLKKGNLA